MANDGRGVLGEPQASGEAIRLAWEKAVADALMNHRDNGVPVATWDWESGRVLLIPADDSSFVTKPTLSDQTGK